MRIVVCVKSVAVLADEVELTPDGLAVDPSHIDRALNEWDACAVEQALLMREVRGEGEVVAVTVGDPEAEPAVRRCLAMGADRGLRIWSDALEHADPITVARALAGAITAEQPDLVLCGVQSSDAVNGATGAALAALLELPCVAVVTAIEWDATAARATVSRELEGGLIDRVELPTPAVLTIQTGINTPRYATFRAIKQADQKPLQTEPPGKLGHPAHRLRRLFVPQRPQGAEMLTGSPAAMADRIHQLVQERLA
jgi:electron transfer flavoprotein alpha/beta subunit